MSSTSAVERVQEALRRAGSDSADGHEWRCPTHEDDSASLTVKVGDEPDRVILRCGAGCETKAVLNRIGLKWADLFDPGVRARDKVVGRKKYVYEDENGDPLFRVVRGTHESGKKSFIQNGADGRGGWRKGSGAMKGVRLALWKLPEVEAAIASRKVIHLTEGEKDAEALSDTGVVATCHPMGAGKWQPQYTETLDGAAEVVVWADRDAAGYRCAAQRLSALQKAGVPARAVLPIPDSKGSDAFDHLASGHRVEDARPATLEDLERLAAAGDEPADTDEILTSVKQLFLEVHDQAHDHLGSLRSDDDVMAMPDPEYVIDGWVPRGVYTILYGEPGVKKTFALLGMSRAVRRGTRWQDHKTIRGSVLFYQGEGLEQLKPRIRAWDSRYPLREDQSMTAGAHTDHFADLTKPEGVAAVIRTVRGYEKAHGSKVEMVVIDPLVEFMTGEENGEGMERATRGLRALAKLQNIAVVVGHHTNASGDRARGADYHRMRAGAHILMEPLNDGNVGLVQHKQKNGQTLALILDAVEHDESLVLEWSKNLLATDYVAMKESAKKRQRDAKDAEKASGGEQKVIAALRSLVTTEKPKVSKAALFGEVGGNRAIFNMSVENLKKRGVVLVEATGAGKATWISIDEKFLGGSGSA